MFLYISNYQNMSRGQMAALKIIKASRCAASGRPARAAKTVKLTIFAEIASKA
jgi:hypothetical protein